MLQLDFPHSDLIFAGIVAGLKQKYPITLEAAIPYPGRMNTPDKEFQRLLKACTHLGLSVTAPDTACLAHMEPFQLEYHGDPSRSKYALCP